MAGPIVVAIHNAFRHDMELIVGFALAATLIEQAVGDDWPELAGHVPELVGAY